MRKKGKTKIKAILHISLYFYVASLLAQNSEVIPIKETTEIYNMVYKNIVYFRIINNSNLKESGVMNLYNISKFLPDSGYNLLLNIKKLDWKFPLNGYHIYSIKKQGWRFVNYNKYEYVRSKEITKEFSMPENYIDYCVDDGYFYSKYSDDYLVAYNNDEKIILFLSGEFYLSNVSQLFSLEINNPKTFIEYLKYKLYYINAKNIEFLKKKRNKIIFKFIYGNNNRKGLVELSSKNFDKLIVHLN